MFKLLASEHFNMKICVYIYLAKGHYYVWLFHACLYILVNNMFVCLLNMVIYVHTYHINLLNMRTVRMDSDTTVFP